MNKKEQERWRQLYDVMTEDSLGEGGTNLYSEIILVIKLEEEKNNISRGCCCCCYFIYFIVDSFS